MISLPIFPLNPTDSEYFWHQLPFAVPGFVTFLIGVLLFIVGIVLRNRKPNNEFLFFGLFSLGVGALGLVISLRAVILDRELLLISNYLLYPVVMLFGPFAFLYIHALTKKEFPIFKIMTYILFITYFLGIYGLITGKAFLNEFHLYYFGAYPISGIWLKPWAALGTLGVVFIMIPVLIVHWRRHRNSESKYVTFGMIIVGLLTVSNMPSLLGYAIPPMAIFNFIPLLIIAYGTYKYDFKDMNNLLYEKHFLFYFFTFLVSSLLLAMALLLSLGTGPELLENSNTFPWVLIPLFSMMIVFILGTNIAAANVNSQLNQLGGFTLFTSGFYTILGVFRTLNLDDIVALRIEQLAYVFFATSPTFYLRFLAKTLNIPFKGWLRFYDLASLACCLLALTPFFFKGFYQYSFARIPASGIGATIFGITGFIGTSTAIILYILSRKVQKNRSGALTAFSIVLSALLLVLSLPSTRGIDFYSFGNLQFIPGTILFLSIYHYGGFSIKGQAIRISQRISLLAFIFLPIIYAILMSAYSGRSTFINVFVYTTIIAIPLFLFLYMALMIFTRPLAGQLDSSFSELNLQKLTVEEKSQELKTINELVKLVNSTIDLDEITEIFFRMIRNFVKVDSIVLLLVDYRNHTLKYYKGIGVIFNPETEKLFRDYEIAIDGDYSFLQNALQKQKTLYLPEITERILNAYRPVDRDIYNLSPYKSLICLPSVFQGMPIGAIMLFNTKDKMEVNIMQRHKLRLFVDQIANAINNAKQFEEGRIQKNLILTQKDKLENLSNSLSKYLSPQVYKSIFDGKQDTSLVTYRKKLTVFFSDIVGFTEITDSIESETITMLLNQYLDEMSKIALKYGGTIDKFIGGAIMIFFGDPESEGERRDAEKCVSMAIEMRKQIKELNREWKNNGLRDLHVRVGINSGYCTVGNFGSVDRLDYTIIGGQVNLASRLEKSADTDEILISGETQALVKDLIYCRLKNKIKVKGIAHEVETYEVIDLLANLGDTQMKEIISIDTEALHMELSTSRINSTAERKKILIVLKDAFNKVKAMPG